MTSSKIRGFQTPLRHLSSLLPDHPPPFSQDDFTILGKIVFVVKWKKSRNKDLLLAINIIQSTI